ncbi:MAG: hypothetical protein Q4C64_07530 [Erysipelotrichia bacterium]|nr:hypothetical protein [Erysipelotrichia bacterium]
MKATKTELENALDLAIEKLWLQNLPTGECDNCKEMTKCKKCWKDYLITSAKGKAERNKEI